MINKKSGYNNMPCPVCKTNIPFDPIMLLKGSSFSCPNCRAVIGISNQSLENAQSVFQRMEQIGKKQKS